jgi:hypothetical protein
VWLFTKYGFFSTVFSDSTGRIVVRARDRSHLERLKLRFPVELDRVRITVTPKADYGFRMFVLRRDWKHCLGELAMELNYSNFKEEAERTFGTRSVYANTLHEVWRRVELAFRPKWKRRREAAEGAVSFLDLEQV